MRISLRLTGVLLFLAFGAVIIAKLDSVATQIYGGPGFIFPIVYTFVFFNTKFSFARWMYMADLAIVYGLLFGYPLVTMLLLLCISLVFEWFIMRFAQRFTFTLVLFFAGLFSTMLYLVYATSPWLLHLYTWLIPIHIQFPSIHATIGYSIAVGIGVLILYPILQKNESAYTLFMKQPYDF